MNNLVNKKIEEILLIVPNGTFISAISTFGISDCLGATASWQGAIVTNTDFISATPHLGYLRTAANWQSRGISISEVLYSLNSAASVVNLQGQYRNDATIIVDPINGTAISATITSPSKPLFMDKCSHQFFTETGLINPFASTCVANNLTGVITYPQLTKEYKDNSIPMGDILFEYGLTILKTANTFTERKHAGEEEILDSIKNNEILRNKAIVLFTNEKGAIEKCNKLNIKNINCWDFVLFMISKNIISWEKAELIYKNFDRFQISGKKEKFETLKDYYDKNYQEINNKLKELIN